MSFFNCLFNREIEASQEISEFTSTAESVDVVAEAPQDNGMLWADCVVTPSIDAPATPIAIPDVLSNMAKKGIKFEHVHLPSKEKFKQELGYYFRLSHY